MNLFRLIHLIITNNSRAAIRMGRDAITHSLRLLQLAIAVPGLLLLIGLIVDWDGLVLFSGLLNVLLLTMFTFWADILAHVVVLKSNIAHAVWSKIPDLERASAQKFIRWLRGITLWISLIWFYAMLLPVREHVAAFLIAMTAALILATIASVRQWSGKLFWMAYSLTAIGTFVFFTVSIASPETAERIRSSAKFHLAKARTVNVRVEQMEAIEQKAVQGSVELDKTLLEQKLARIDVLKRKGITDPACGGQVCTADLKEYLQLAEDIRKLKDDSYWPADPVGGKQAALPAPPVETADDASGDDAATMAPPSVDPVETKPKGKVDRPVEAAATYEEDVDSVIGKYSR